MLQTLEQKPAARKTNSPILHANGNPAPSRFPSIYFWVSLEKKNIKSNRFCQTVGVTEGGGGRSVPALPARHPSAGAEPTGASPVPGRGAGSPDPPSPVGAAPSGCSSCKRPPLQEIPAPPVLQSPPCSHTAGDHFPAGAGFGPGRRARPLSSALAAFMVGLIKDIAVPASLASSIYPE